jgi:hypothetical protein
MDVCRFRPQETLCVVPREIATPDMRFVTSEIAPRNTCTTIQANHETRGARAGESCLGRFIAIVLPITVEKKKWPWYFSLSLAGVFFH